MEKEERKSRTLKLRQIELIIWLVILLVLGICGHFLIDYYHSTYESHNIYMPDVDGLIVGSPVYMMGVPVGHVTKTKIVKDDEIKVRFKITNRSIHIPPGTVATVEFSGLGGSKSLQLYPANSNKEFPPELIVGHNEYIQVQRPRRLRDTFALLYEMYNTLMDIIYTMSNFGNNVRNVELPSVSVPSNNLPEFVNFYDDWLDSSTNGLKKLRKAIEKYDVTNKAEQKI